LPQINKANHEKIKIGFYNIDLYNPSGHQQKFTNFYNKSLGTIQVLRYQMMMFDDKVGGWGWPNDDVSKKYTKKKNLCFGIFLKKPFFRR
jgi:hypothetical protein